MKKSLDNLVNTCYNDVVMSEYTEFQGTIVTSRVHGLNIEPFAEKFLGNGYAEAKKSVMDFGSWDDYFEVNGDEQFRAWLSYKMLHPITINEEGLAESMAARLEPELWLIAKNKTSIFNPEGNRCPFKSSMPLDHPSGNLWYAKVNSPCGFFDMHFYRGSVEEYVSADKVKAWLEDVHKYLRTKSINFNIVNNIEEASFVCNSEYNPIEEIKL